MNTTTTHIARARLALLLLAVFAVSLLVKPVHMLTHQHDELHETIWLNSNQHSISGGQHETCPICDFEFCQFIPQQNTSVPQATAIVYQRQSARSIACLIRQSSHHFQLRAPPVV